MYWLCFKLDKPYLFTEKTCGMLGNVSMACDSSPNNIHHPQDGLVFVISSNWEHTRGLNGCEEDVVVQSTTPQDCKPLCMMDTIWIRKRVFGYLGPSLQVNTT